MDQENRVETEIDLNEDFSSNGSAELDISFANTDEQNPEETVREEISMDESDAEPEDKEENKEETVAKPEEEREEEEENTVPGPDEKGMTSADYKKWAQDYNCTEEEVIEALDMGWHGPKGFSKDKTFLTPTEFLEKSRKNAPIMYQRWKQAKQEAEESRKMQKQMYDSIMEISKKNTKAALDEKQKIIDELTAQLKTAKDDFDVEEIEKLALKKHQAEQEKEQMERNQKQTTGFENTNINIDLENDWVQNSETAQLIKSDPMLLARAGEVIKLLNSSDNFKDWTSEQRIAYLERQFGRKQVSKPAATSVGRATPGAASKASNVITWDSVPAEFKNFSLEMVKDLPWYKTRNTDEKSKKIFESYKQDIINSYKKGL